MKLNIIVAMTNNQIIGLDNKMPWHLPNDLAWFKKNTLNKPVIMGRKTFESIGRALPNRLNIVISRSEHASFDNVIYVKNIDEALNAAKNHEDVFIIGGGNIYQQFLPLASKLYLTHIDVHLDGDTTFPSFDRNEWKTLFKEPHLKDDKNNYNYTFEILERI